jgi:hypothetical protein
MNISVYEFGINTFQQSEILPVRTELAIKRFYISEQLKNDLT